jgi:hypothetical protein
MTGISICPDESELLAAATGEPTSDAILQHVDVCKACSGRVERLRAEVSALRRDLGEGLAADPTGTEPAEAGEGESSGGGAADPPAAAAGGLSEDWPERPVAIGKYVVVDLLDWMAERSLALSMDPMDLDGRKGSGWQKGVWDGRKGSGMAERGLDGRKGV